MERQILFQVTSSLVNMEEVERSLLNGTFGYFRTTKRQEGEGTPTPSDSSAMTLELRALNPNEWLA